MFGDYLLQESSEKEIAEIIKQDEELQLHLANDNILLEDLENLNDYSVLENKSPHLCTDRLDGVLHTCHIWLHTHNLEEIKEVYDDIIILTNEEGKQEIGFKTLKIAEKFVNMVYTYGQELQSNTNKYATKYVSEIVKLSFEKQLITLEDLYIKKEQAIVDIFNANFKTWTYFTNSSQIVRTEEKPNNFYISFDTKKRNVIPLIKSVSGNKRIIDVSENSKKVYSELEKYQDTKYAYIESIKQLL